MQELLQQNVHLELDRDNKYDIVCMFYCRIYPHTQVSLNGRKSGRPGRFGDEMMIHVHLPPFLQTVAEIVTDTSSLHHQIDQAFLMFFVYIEKHGKAWVRGYVESSLLW